MSLMISFPVALGGDFAGLIFFAIFAIVAWLTNRARTAGESQPQAPQSSGGGKGSTDDTLEEWLKGLVDEQKAPPKQHQPPPLRPPPVTRPAPTARPQRPPMTYEPQRRVPPPLRTAPPPQHVPPVQRTATKPSRRPAPAPVPSVVQKPSVAPTRLAPSGPDIQGEIHDLASKVADDVHTTTEELIGAPMSAAAAASSRTEEPTRIARLLRTPGGLREGVILMEVLGRPRAFSA
jgi:hypothetical protein